MHESIGKSDCVVSDAVVTDEKLNVMNTSMYNMLNVRQGRLYNLLCHNGYSGCCMAFKRKVLERALPFRMKYLCMIYGLAMWLHSIILLHS